MIDSVFEVVICPSMWDGREADIRLGLYTTMLHAEQDAAEWVRTHVYPYRIGEWSIGIVEVPLDTVLVRPEYMAKVIERE